MRNLIIKALQKIGEIIEVPIAQLDGYGLETAETPSRIKLMRQVRPIAYLKASTGNIEDMPTATDHKWGKVNFVEDTITSAGATEIFEIRPPAGTLWWLYLVGGRQQSGGGITVLLDFFDGTSSYLYLRDSAGESTTNNRWHQFLPTWGNNLNAAWAHPLPLVNDWYMRVIFSAMPATKKCYCQYMYMEVDAPAGN